MFWTLMAVLWVVILLFAVWVRKQETKLKAELEEIEKNIQKIKNEIAERERKIHVERLRKAMERSIRN